MSKLNAAILFKNILDVSLTERDWNPNYPEILFVGNNLQNKFGNKWSFQYNSNFNFSGTVILQLWLLYIFSTISPFCHFTISCFKHTPCGGVSSFLKSQCQTKLCDFQHPISDRSQNLKAISSFENYCTSLIDPLLIHGVN